MEKLKALQTWAPTELNSFLESLIEVESRMARFKSMLNNNLTPSSVFVFELWESIDELYMAYVGIIAKFDEKNLEGIQTKVMTIKSYIYKEFIKDWGRVFVKKDRMEELLKILSFLYTEMVTPTRRVLFEAKVEVHGTYIRKFIDNSKPRFGLLEKGKTEETATIK